MLPSTIARASLALLVAPILARNVPSTVWPVERLVTNLEKRLSASPSDASAHYELGRVHAFAFALEALELENRGLRFTTAPSKQAGRPDSPVSAEDLIGHLDAAISSLRNAVELKPETAYYRLTLAWILESGSHLASRFDTVELLGLADFPRTGTELEIDAREATARSIVSAMWTAADTEGFLADLTDSETIAQCVIELGDRRVSPVASIQSRIDRLLTRCWIEQAIYQYSRAFQHAIVSEVGDDKGTPFVRRSPHESVSWEAGQSFLRLARERSLGPEEEELATRIEARLKALESMEVREFITPILLSLDDCAALDQLVTPNLSVPFDLDGDAVDELWPWITPGTGWLVWDPERRGEITSGRQLFGSASGWLFFEDGYRVLDALDDDRNGELRGPELAGIAVWFDRDSDGVSDRGEVVPVEELGIVALATESTLAIGPSPANLCGLEMSDGRVLPTYDWVLEPALVP